MKNKFAIITALVLASTSVVTAYAVNSEKNDGSEPTNINVTGSYIDSKSTTMSVDVEWEEMNFTYFGGHKVWDPRPRCPAPCRGQGGTKRHPPP